MFTKILIANRGEIAVRVIRTLRTLGIGSVAVYSDADAGARHVREADVAIRLGPAPPAESYLHIARILAAAGRSGAQAVHPGYGFLAENAAFARACGDAGLVFIGPPPAAIEAMGDKIRAKARVAAAGVPVVPGAGRPGMTDAELAAAAAGVGFPLLIKPSAGGGGKGMRLVRSAADLSEAFAGARREARGAFGDDTLLLERYVERPRHIEIQVLAPLLDETRRAAMGRAAVEAARSVGYVGAGTVEFIVPGDQPGDFYFLEMNTRLQVEHPVTELVTGLDLVELQIRVAAGEPLPFRQDDVRLSGHAIEARLYAEDPSRGFLPTGGTVLALREPGSPFVRVDSGLAPGMTVTSSYDPMLAKIAAWGADRDTALRRLDAALADTTVLGVSTNLAFLRALLTHPDVVAGDLDTGLIERHLGQLTAADVPDEVLAAGALARLLAREPAGPVTDPWDIPDGWRPGQPAWTLLRLTCAPRETTEVRVRGRAGLAAEVAVGDTEPVPARAERHGGELVLTIDGRTVRYAYAEQTGAPGGGLLWLGRDGHAWAVREEPRLTARAAKTHAADGIVASPMPGTVLAVNVTEGQEVAFGQPLLIVEAMKMEHTVTAPLDGTVTDLMVKPGQQVAMDETLAVVHAGEQAG